MKGATHIRGRRAFTLIEIMVVLAIVGILMGMILPSFVMVKQRAKFTRWLMYNLQMSSDSTTVLNYNFMDTTYKIRSGAAMAPAVRNSAVGCGADGFVPALYDGVLVNGPEWVERGGRWSFNNAIQLDGRDDYIEVPGVKALDFKPGVDDYTISIWCRFDKPAGTVGLFAKSEWAQVAQYDLYLQGKKLIADAGLAASSWKSPAPVAGRWTNYTLVCSGMNMELYCDGAPMGAEKKVRPANSNVSPAKFLVGAIGSKGGAPKFNFQGRIDELLVIGRALSASEVRGIYEMGNPY